MSEINYDEVREYFYKRLFVKVKDEHFDELLNETPELRKEFVEGTYRDSFPRDWFTHIFVDKICEMEYPVNADSQEYVEKFFDAYVEGLKKHGYQREDTAFK